MSIGAIITTIGSAGVGGESYYVARFEPTTSTGTVTGSPCCLSECVTNCASGSGCCQMCSCPYYCFQPFWESQIDLDFDGNIYTALLNCGLKNNVHLAKLTPQGKVEYLKTYLRECTLESPGTWRTGLFSCTAPDTCHQCTGFGIMYDSYNNMVRTFSNERKLSSYCGQHHHLAFNASTGAYIEGSNCSFFCEGVSGSCPVQTCTSSCGYYHTLSSISNPLDWSNAGYGPAGVISTPICLCTDGTLGLGRDKSWGWPSQTGGNSTDQCVIQGGPSAFHYIYDRFKYCNSAQPQMFSTLSQYWGCYPKYNQGVSTGCSYFCCRRLSNVHYASQAIRHCNTTNSAMQTTGLLKPINGTCAGLPTLYRHGCTFVCFDVGLCTMTDCMYTINYVCCNCFCAKMYEFILKDDFKNPYMLSLVTPAGASANCDCAIILTKFKDRLNGYCWSKKITVPIAYSRPCWAGTAACCWTYFKSIGFRVDHCTDSVILFGTYERCCAQFADTTCFAGYGYIPFIMRFSASEPPTGSYDHFCFEDYTFSMNLFCCRCQYLSCCPCGSLNGLCVTNGHNCGVTCYACPNSCFTGSCTRRIIELQTPLNATCVVKMTKI